MQLNWKFYYGGASPQMMATSRRLYGYQPNSDDHYSIEGSSQLRIKVIAGKNLAKKDIFGASDPYVRIDLIAINGDVILDTVFSKTKKKTLNPQWDEEFIFRVKPAEHKIVLQVFDENRFTRDDFLGMVEINLVHIPKEQMDGRQIPTISHELRPRRSVGAKSKVRGTLELYNAYMFDTSTANADGTSNEWEEVDGNGDSTPSTNIFDTATHLDTLPPGWDERQDANGRTYYCNHQERTTQWQRPTFNTAAGNVNNAAAEFQRRFHISVDESDRSIQRVDNDDEIVENVDENVPSQMPDGVSDGEDSNENEATGDDVDDVLLHEEEDAKTSIDSNMEMVVIEDENLGDTVSLNSSMTSLNTIERQRNDSITSSSSNIRPVRPAPAIPRALERSSVNNHKRTAPIVPPRSSTVSPPEISDANQSSVSNIENTSTTSNDIIDNQINNVSLRDEDQHSNSENEDVDTSDSSNSNTTANNNNINNNNHTGQSSSASESPASHTSRQSSTEENASGSNPDAGLPPGWSIQVAPNGRLFFINHPERITTWIDPRTGLPSPMPKATAEKKLDDDLGPMPEGWEERVHSDGRVFYIDHNNRTTQWDDPRLLNPTIAGHAVPYSRDYKQKYEYFKSQLKKPTNVPNKFEIKVRRGSILEDSYRVVNSVTKTDLLKTKLWIEFEGETGLDYGGLAREWFFLLSKEMFNPYYGLFEYSAMDNYTLQINPFSGLCNEEHLSYFKFIGRIAGMAVYHGKLLDAFFIRPFYKMMLQKPIDLRDMESVDMEYYNSLLWIKENDPRELMLTFCIDEETFGATSQRELKPNGANIDVADENKDEYIKLVIEWRFVSRVKEQMAAFLEGFGSFVPLPLLKIFDENELELLMCGIQNIDVKDWKLNTLYKGDYHKNHLIIQWFWRAVLTFSNEVRSRLLQFVTGTSRVPMNGFKELYGSNGPQMFTIEKWGTPDNYPRAHTCFNRLDLPPYESYAQLREKLIKAIEGSEGFAGVD